jgi:hypothetical protein
MIWAGICHCHPDAFLRRLVAKHSLSCMIIICMQGQLLPSFGLAFGIANLLTTPLGQVGRTAAATTAEAKVVAAALAAVALLCSLL